MPKPNLWGETTQVLCWKSSKYEGWSHANRVSESIFMDSEVFLINVYIKKVFLQWPVYYTG